LLSLDGSRELPASGARVARFGVDGDANTCAEAAIELPWTYEVDLLDISTVRRVKVTFAPCLFATQLRIQVSIDRKSWQTVAAADGLAGQPFESQLSSSACRYVRVSALQPSERKQPGVHMVIAELEVYE
jgi:hypothetical protein